MMMGLELCIDLGSSRTKVAFLDQGARKELVELGRIERTSIPTVFLLSNTGQVLLGEEAVSLMEREPEGIVVDAKQRLHDPDKIHLGTGRPTPTAAELIEALLRNIKRRCELEVFHGQRVERCVLTVPVLFQETDREALAGAARGAGFTSVRLVEEPVAAARHWLEGASSHRLGDHVIVVDVGGGTTDFASLRRSEGGFEALTELSSGGFEMGGNHIDAALVKSLGVPPLRRAAWQWTVRRAKEQVGMGTFSAFPVNFGGEQREISRDQVLHAIGVLLDRLEDGLTKYLADFQRATKISNCPVLLAGGGSRIPGIRERVERIVPGRVVQWTEGDVAIVKGGLTSAPGATGKVPPTAASPRSTTAPAPGRVPSDRVQLLLAEGKAAVAQRGLASSLLQDAEQELERLSKEVVGPFRLGILGQFRAGKSSLVNAFAGRPIAYTDTREATPCVLCYRDGQRDLARVIRTSGAVEELTIPALNRRLEDWRNETAWLEGIDHVEVTAVGTRLGDLELWDGPGLGGSHVNEVMAQRFISSVTAAIWVLNATTLGNLVILEPLKQLRHAGKPVLFVLNKVDVLDESELSDCMDYVTGTVGDDAVGVLPLCASAASATEKAGGTDRLLQAIRDTVRQKLVETAVTTSEERYRRSEERGALVAWRALENTRRPLQESVDWLDVLRLELEESARSLMKRLPTLIEEEASKAWHLEHRQVEYRVQQAVGSIRSATGVMPDFLGIRENVLSEAERAYGLEAGWENVERHVRSRLVDEWNAHAGRGLDIARGSVNSGLPSRRAELVPVTRAARDPGASYRDTSDEEAAAMGVVVGVNAAGALAVAAAASVALTWPIVLLAVPAGLGSAYLKRESKRRKDREQALQVAADLPAEAEAILTERRAVLLHHLEKDLPPQVEKILAENITVAVEAERKNCLPSLSREEARGLNSELMALQRLLLPLMEKSSRMVHELGSLTLRGDAEGLSLLDQLLQLTDSIDLAVTGSAKGVAALAARLPTNRSFRVLLWGESKTLEREGTELKKILEHMPARLEIRVLPEAVPHLEQTPCLLLTDQGAWRTSEGLELLGQKSIHLRVWERGRLAASRAFAAAWKHPNVRR